MRLEYRTLVTDNGKCLELNKESMEYCCDNMKSEFLSRISFEIDPPWHSSDLFVGFIDKYDTPDECVEFHYCPFCGEAIEREYVGTFKRVVEEVPIDE